LGETEEVGAQHDNFEPQITGSRIACVTDAPEVELLWFAPEDDFFIRLKSAKLSAWSGYAF
jgi:hypothetical protein